MLLLPAPPAAWDPFIFRAASEVSSWVGSVKAASPSWGIGVASFGDAASDSVHIFSVLKPLQQSTQSSEFMFFNAVKSIPWGHSSASWTNLLAMAMIAGQRNWQQNTRRAIVVYCDKPPVWHPSQNAVNFKNLVRIIIVFTHKTALGFSHI
jgi:hypothetical protein